MLPKKLKIGALNYDVKQVKDLKDGSVECMGLHTFHKRLIQVDSELDNQVGNMILFHEALHGIFDTQEIVLEGPAEEHVISNLTHGLIKFMQDNPTFIKQLMKG